MALANNFYNSLLKKRIIMLHKTRSNRKSQWKIALITPLLIAFVFAFNTKTIAQKKKVKKESWHFSLSVLIAFIPSVIAGVFLYSYIKDIFASDYLVTERINEVKENGINKFFIRRLKEDMKDWDGNPLSKQRHTKTILYKLTADEKRLYDRVTDYLTKKRSEAEQESNIHVSLALMVMQRRLTSSIQAILYTLRNRYNALKRIIYLPCSQF